MIIKNLPEFKSEKELFKFLVENEEQIFAAAKSQIKYADGFSHYGITLKKYNAEKSSEEQIEDLLTKDVLETKLIINTTNILDSHKDVHIDGLWKKSLKESSSRLLHVQEHKSREFDKIISSGQDLKAYIENSTFKDLGYDFEGFTEALVFESKVRKERNEYMHKQYAKGYVTNHSVGMIYDKLVTCINDEEYPVQKENWDKYSVMVANKSALQKTKYFWAVLEAKVIEGSAVPNGSNFVTPTTSVKSQQNVPTEAEKKEEAELKAIKEFLGIKAG
jgi:hypothetical protein